MKDLDKKKKNKKKDKQSKKQPKKNKVKEKNQEKSKPIMKPKIECNLMVLRNYLQDDDQDLCNLTTDEIIDSETKQRKAALTIPKFNQNPVITFSKYNLQDLFKPSDRLEIPCQSLSRPIQPQNSFSRDPRLRIIPVKQPLSLYLPITKTVYRSLTEKSNNTLTQSGLMFAGYNNIRAKIYHTLEHYVSQFDLFIHNKSKAANSPIKDSSLSSGSKSLSLKRYKISPLDPRVNRSFNAEGPLSAPKCKLTLNAYRNRKQEPNETGRESDILCSAERERNKIFKSFDADLLDKTNVNTKVKFDPAPTDLERYQEIMCEKYKLIKNKNLDISKILSISGIGEDGSVVFDNFLLNSSLKTENNVKSKFLSALEESSSNESSPTSTVTPQPDDSEDDDNNVFISPIDFVNNEKF